jgi:hypothetical protein
MNQLRVLQQQIVILILPGPMQQQQLPEKENAPAFVIIRKRSEER